MTVGTWSPWTLLFCHTGKCHSTGPFPLLFFVCFLIHGRTPPPHRDGVTALSVSLPKNCQHTWRRAMTPLRGERGKNTESELHEREEFPSMLAPYTVDSTIEQAAPRAPLFPEGLVTQSSLPACTTIERPKTGWSPVSDTSLLHGTPKKNTGQYTPPEGGECLHGTLPTWQIHTHMGGKRETRTKERTWTS